MWTTAMYWYKNVDVMLDMFTHFRTLEEMQEISDRNMQVSQPVSYMFIILLC